MSTLQILIIGPLPKPITGVSLANQIILDYLHKYTKMDVDYINTNYSVIKEDIGKFNFKKVLYYMKQYKGLYKIKKNDIVYMTIGQTFFGVLKYYPYFLYAKLLKKEIIVHIHGNHLWKEYENLRGIKKKIFYNILSMTNKGIVLSNSLRKNLTPFLADDKIYVLENFVEDFLYENLIEKKFNKLRIIYLSNLMQEKGILDLLDALRILKEKNINFEAQIAGGIDTNIKNVMESYFEQLDTNVTYLGLVYGEDKKRLLEWGNVFVFPTYYSMEGQPISNFEAMATGNVILTTKHAGIPDVFEENINGFYVEKNSPQSIVKMLEKISNNMDICVKISRHNIKEARDKYRVETFIKKLDRILRD